HARAVREAFAHSACRLHSTFTGLAAYSSNLLLHPGSHERLRAVQWWERAIDVTAAMGAPATGGHLRGYRDPDWRDERRRSSLDAELRAALWRLASYAGDRG